MIIVGAHLGGPDNINTLIDKTIRAIMQAEREVTGDFQEGSAPAVNVIYCVAGSFVQPDWDHGQIVRYSRKSKMLLVQVAVPQEVVDSLSPLDYLIQELHGAVVLAFHHFMDKKIEYPIAKAEKLVNQIREQAAARLQIA